MDEFESVDTEEELRESYPFLFGDVAEGAWDPPGYKLSPEQEKFRETQRQKLLEERIVVDEHGENYQYIDDELGVSQANVSRCLKAADQGEMPLSL